MANEEIHLMKIIYQVLKALHTDTQSGNAHEETLSRVNIFNVMVFTIMVNKTIVLPK